MAQESLLLPLFLPLTIGPHLKGTRTPMVYCWMPLFLLIPPSSPTPIGTNEGNELVVPVNLNKVPTPIDHEDDGMVQPNGGGETEPGVDNVLPTRVLEASEAHAKKVSYLSNETLFEGNLSESKEETSNILQNEEEIIEGFITTMANKGGGIGERTPPTEQEEFDTMGEPDLSIHESGEKSFQEKPLVTDPPKWDGTPTPSVPGVASSPSPSVLL
ncbi:hypothetical protein HAX54_050431 [Datura stramonium]|uniref:Uncharacterized protein n=1 Tax=Datura stramonium TaxID=4076 RepID=A0ABS8SWZ1_DATST|nr:hypothetical protein [Datura stramonium]